MRLTGKKPIRPGSSFLASQFEMYPGATGMRSTPLGGEEVVDWLQAAAVQRQRNREENMRRMGIPDTQLDVIPQNVSSEELRKWERLRELGLTEGSAEVLMGRSAPNVLRKEQLNLAPYVAPGDPRAYGTSRNPMYETPGVLTDLNIRAAGLRPRQK